MTQCERCEGGSPRDASKMSFFNTDMICEDCQAIEESHPLFQLAKDVEYQAYLNGDRNYPGIGLPEDYEQYTIQYKKQETK